MAKSKKDETCLYPAGIIRHKVRIENSWHVLDAGCGHSPHPRANVILDKYAENSYERGGEPLKIHPGQKFIESDVCSMPFKDKEFDYIIASHIAEHMDSPEAFCRELMRVGKAGYIETPGLITEFLLGDLFHKWYVYGKGETLIFKKKKKHNPAGLLGSFFYALFYINQEREDRKTVCFQNKLIKKITNRIAYILLHKPWRIMKKFTYTCFEWNERIQFKIIE